MKIVRRKRAMRFAALVLGATAIVCPRTAVGAQTAPEAGSNKSFEIDVPGTKEWVDTNVDVRGGAKLRFTATGKITYPADTSYKGKIANVGDVWSGRAPARMG